MADAPRVSPRLAAWLAILPGLVLAAWLRLPDLASRPMHTDEAVQADTTGRLLDTGLAAYKYDPVEYHGPTLYYLTLPLARARDQTSHHLLDETTLRLLPALFGIGLLLWLPLFRGPMKPAGIGAAALLLAASPVFTFYSRYYIQEMLLVFFSLGLAASLVRWRATGATGWAVVAGLMAGLMHATKETAILTFGAMGGALLVAAWASPPPRLPAHWKRHAAIATAAALLVSGVFLSSFLTHLRGPLDSVLTFFNYADKAVNNDHTKPWGWYAATIFWHRSAPGPAFHELLLLVPGLLGLGLVVLRTALRIFQPGAMAAAVWFVLLAAVYSAIPYKTPWLVLNPLLPLALLAGLAADTFCRKGARVRFRTTCVALLLAAGTWNASGVARLVTGRFASDPRNPYAYSHPLRGLVSACNTLNRLAAQRKEPLLVHVIADEYWPLPWYLRGANIRAGYWNSAAPPPYFQPGRTPGETDADRLPDVFIIDETTHAAWPAHLPPTHVRVQGLRPGVHLFFRIRSEVWDAFKP